MLTTYRRHQKSCPHKNEERKYRRCRCPIWLDGTVRGEEIRESLRTTNWEQVLTKARAREMEVPGSATEEAEPVPLAYATAEFLADLRRRHLEVSTISKYELLFRQMANFAEHKGIRYLIEFDLVTLREFFATWTQGDNTVSKKLERLRSFFRFSLQSEWIAKNPAAKIQGPRVKQSPTLPFNQEEVASVLAACDRYPDSYGRTGQVERQTSACACSAPPLQRTTDWRRRQVIARPHHRQQTVFVFRQNRNARLLPSTGVRYHGAGCSRTQQREIFFLERIIGKSTAWRATRCVT